MSSVADQEQVLPGKVTDRPNSPALFGVGGLTCACQNVHAYLYTAMELTDSSEDEYKAAFRD